MNEIGRGINDQIEKFPDIDTCMSTQYLINVHKPETRSPDFRLYGICFIIITLRYVGMAMAFYTCYVSRTLPSVSLTIHGIPTLPL